MPVADVSAMTSNGCCSHLVSLVGSLFYPLVRPLFNDFLFFITARTYFHCLTYFPIITDLAIITLNDEHMS